MIKKLVTAMLMTSTIAYAANNNSVELNINSNTLEIAGEFNLNDTYNLNNESQYAFTLSYLGSEKDNENDKLIRVGAKIMNPYINDNGISFGLGAQLVWADNSNNSFMALPLNVFGKFEFNESIHVNASLAYAPKVLSFSDSEGFTAIDLKANYKLLDNGYAYVGKRYIQTRYNNNIEGEFDDSVFFGFKVLF